MSNFSLIKIFLIILMLNLFCVSHAQTDFFIGKDSSYTTFVDSVNQLDWEDQPIADSTLLWQALKISDSLQYSNGLANTYYNFANYYLMQSNGARTLFYALKSIEKSKAIENYKLLIKGFITVANVYVNENNDSQASDNLFLATQYATMHDKSQLTVCYNAIGYNYCMTGNYLKAEDYFYKAIDEAKEFNDSRAIGRAYTNLSILYRYKGNYYKAVEFGQIADQYYQKVKYQRGILVNLTGLGICYSKLGNMSMAIESHQKVLKLARQHGDMESLGNAYYGFYTVYKEFGHYQEALDWYERLENLEDSVINKQNQEKIIELTRFYTNVKQESEITLLKKEQQIQLLEIQKTRFIMLLVMVFLITIIVIGFMFYRFKQNKNKAQLRELVLKAELSERKRIARDLHDNIGSHLAYLVGGLEQISKENPNEKLVQLEGFGRDAISQLRETIWAIQSNNTEVLSFVDRVRALINRYNDSVQVEFKNLIGFNATQKLTALQTLYLYRMVQESLSNTYKYAMATRLSIEFIMETPALLAITISDNGKGFDTQKATNGNGLKNMEQRAFEISASYRLTSSPGKGTTIKIECPVN
jgi:signal transduction histidine kinase